MEKKRIFTAGEEVTRAELTHLFIQHEEVNPLEGSEKKMMPSWWIDNKIHHYTGGEFYVDWKGTADNQGVIQPLD